MRRYIKAQIAILRTLRYLYLLEIEVWPPNLDAFSEPYLYDLRN